MFVQCHAFPRKAFANPIFKQFSGLASHAVLIPSKTKILVPRNFSLFGFCTADRTGKMKLKDGDRVCIVLRGIPFNTTDDEVQKFFNGYNYILKTLKFGTDENNRRTGLASILFNSEEETAKVYQEKQGQSIRHRWIELFIHDYWYYTKFNEFQANQKYVPLSSYVTEENKNRVIVLVGLPYSADESKILEFVKEFNVALPDIVIGKKGGKSIGKAIVFLKNEEQVDNAVMTLNNQYIGDRFVLVKKVFSTSYL